MQRHVMVALLALGAGIASLASCGGGEEPPASEIVSRTVEATGAVASFHFVYDTQNPQPPSAGLTLTYAEGDVAAPDRVAADVSGSLLGVSIQADLIAIGQDVYLRDPLTRQWRAVDVDTSPLDLFDPDTGVLGVISRAEGLELAGSEDVDGVETYRLVGTVPRALVAPLVAVEPRDGDVAVEVFVGKEDGLLRRVVLDGPIGEEDPEDAVRTIELSAFEEPVAIEAPDLES